jgi:hypothetical protein
MACYAPETPVDYPILAVKIGERDLGRNEAGLLKAQPPRKLGWLGGHSKDKAVEVLVDGEVRGARAHVGAVDHDLGAR